MKTINEERFLRIPYEMLQIPNLTKSDLLALAYNHGQWTRGYFAKSTTAAAKLNLNIKTFRASVTKLKKLGLWTVRGEQVEPRTYSISKDLESSDKDQKSLDQESNSIAKDMNSASGEYKKAFLPIQTEFLLDYGLNTELENDKIEILDSAATAAPNYTSSYFKELESRGQLNQPGATSVVLNIISTASVWNNYQQFNGCETGSNPINRVFFAEPNPLSGSVALEPVGFPAGATSWSEVNFVPSGRDQFGKVFQLVRIRDKVYRRTDRWERFVVYPDGMPKMQIELVREIMSAPSGTPPPYTIEQRRNAPSDMNAYDHESMTKFEAYHQMRSAPEMLPLTESHLRIAEEFDSIFGRSTPGKSTG